MTREGESLDHLRQVSQTSTGSPIVFTRQLAVVFEEVDRLTDAVRDCDELLEAAHAEIERLREESRAAAAREIRDRDEILEVRDDALRRLRVAVEALENLPRLTLEALQGRCDAALAKIRGGG